MLPPRYYPSYARPSPPIPFTCCFVRHCHRDIDDALPRYSPVHRKEQTDKPMLFLRLLLLSLSLALTIPTHLHDFDALTQLVKRKGGGGGGGRGGGGSSSGSSGSGSGTSGTSGGGLGGASRGSVGAAGATGPFRGYNSGPYWNGGSSFAYRAGGVSPLGLAPLFLGVGLLSFWPGWQSNAYAYRYPQNVEVNGTSLPVDCLCDSNKDCGCDSTSNATYIQSLPSGVTRVADVNGTQTLIINGTLPLGADSVSVASTLSLPPLLLITLSSMLLSEL